MADPSPAGPASAAGPVRESDREHLLDVLRGAALLGILLLNITGFAMPEYADEVYKTDTGSVDFWASSVVEVVFAGKMRALFGMLFGAGVLLFAGKKARAGGPVTGLFYRRMFWLVVFGLFHAHLILWVGDILYLYGLCGMIVYLLRNVRPGILAAAVPLVAVIDFSAGAVLIYEVRSARFAYLEAQDARDHGRPLSDDQEAAIARWLDIEQKLLPSRADAAQNTEKMKSDYPTVAGHVRKLALEVETTLVPVVIWDSLSLMLLGVALYRWGFLSGRWSARQYWWVLAGGYGLGLPVALVEAYHGFASDPTREGILARLERTPVDWIGLLYPCQRILLVLGHVSGLILLYKHRHTPRLFVGLAAVGRMAFTNYILQSVVCTLVFFGYGLNYYGELRYYQLLLFVVAVGLGQIVFSVQWLRAFQMGPLEWVWRSLVYGRRQPFARQPAVGPSAGG